MWKNHSSLFNDNIRYVIHDITKYFKVSILKYASLMCECFELACYISLIRNNCDYFYTLKWKDCNKHLSYEIIYKDIKDSLPTFM